VLWKSNKKVLVCQRISEVSFGNLSQYERDDVGYRRNVPRAVADSSESLVGDGALKEFSERIAQRKNFSKVL